MAEIPNENQAASPKKQLSSENQGKSGSKKEQTSSANAKKNKKQIKQTANGGSVLRAVSSNNTQQTSNKSSTKPIKGTVPASAQSIWGNTIETILSSTTKEAEQFQGTAYAISFEGIENLNNLSESALGYFDESINLYKDNLETLLNSCSASQKALLSIQELFYTQSEELSSSSNNSLQDFFLCTTANDFFTLQSKLVKKQLDQSIETFSELTDILLDFSNEVLSPMGEQVIALSKKMSANFSKAA